MGFTQDMPPPGGYAPITYKRVPMKAQWNPIFKVGLLLATSFAGMYAIRKCIQKVNNEAIEARCSRIAMYPMLQAETDRMILKQLQRNRDAEERIMKDVKGWEVGKWKTMSIYETLGPDDYVKPSPYEYYCHTDMDRFMFTHNVIKII